MALLDRDRWARGILARAWAPYGTPQPAALQAAQAIAHLESGGGYGAPGTSDPAWAGSNNWGAIKCAGTSGPPCPSGCFEHADTDANGQAGVYCFKSYATPDDGAAGFLHELMRRPRVAAVLASGSATAIATAMRAPPAYMALSAPAYARLIAQRAALLSKRLGEPLYVTLSGPSSSSADLGELALALLGGLAIARLLKRRR